MLANYLVEVMSRPLDREVCVRARKLTEGEQWKAFRDMLSPDCLYYRIVYVSSRKEAIQQTLKRQHRGAKILNGW